VIMPQMGESIFEGTLTKWLKKPGDKVVRDEPLFEISTDKVDAEIPAPASGVLKEVKVGEGTTVQVNTIVGVIDAEGSAVVAAPKPAPAAPAPAPAKPTAAPAPVAAAPAPAPVAASTPAASGPGTDVIMPQMGESIFEGTITKWLKNVGDKVTRDEPLFEISTDKVDAEIPAPAGGVLSAILIAAGTTVQVNSVVARIGGAAGAAAPAPAAQPAAAAPKAAAPVASAPTPAAPAPAQVVPAFGTGTMQYRDRTAAGERILASPLVKRIAKDNNVDLNAVPGTGLNGRITRDDIGGFLQSGGAARAAAPAAAAPARAAAPAAAPAPMQAPAMQPAFQGSMTLGPDLADEVVPASVMRKKIAHHMIESRRTSAHVHCMFEVDMTRIVNYRNKIRKDWEARNSAKLTFMPFFARAVVKCLQQWPNINASFDGENMVLHKHINIGIAVALDNGLIVPVVKHSEERSFVGLQRGIADVGERARTKKLKPEEVQGSTFTITNPGQFGAVFGLPIINQPNLAILGVGGITKQPMVLTDPDGTDYIAIRSVVHLTLGYDHRVIDGAVADAFMAQIKKTLEGWNEDIG
jgi:pyruvate dehydrogenase E2 component (dihydrolipoyllysine-residue acetyltransferase)